MKHIRSFAISATLLALGACGQTPTFNTLCLDLIKDDPEAVREIARENISIPALCSCYGEQIDLTGEAVQTVHRDVLTEIIKLREDHSIGVEGAAEMLEIKLRADDPALSFGEQEFQDVGKFLDRISDQLEDGGSCGAPE